MVLCDSRVWLALTLSRHAHHGAAREWFEAVGPPASVSFCRATQQTLLRLLTNASVLSPYGNPPLTNQQAWGVYEALLADDRIAFQAEEPGGLEPLWEVLPSAAPPRQRSGWTRTSPPSPSRAGIAW